jgi:pyruvate ferredoxin oxidoreductase alpha subunit
MEVRDALYGSTIPVKGYVIGLGGRDVRKKDIKEIVSLAQKGANDQFYGLRREVL